MALVGVAVFELHLPGSRSLKEKRRTVKSLLDRLHRRQRISIAETGFHDLRQRSQLTLALVVNSPADLTRLMSRLRATIEEEPEALLSHWHDEAIELL